MLSKQLFSKDINQLLQMMKLSVKFMAAFVVRSFATIPFRVKVMTPRHDPLTRSISCLQRYSSLIFCKKIIANFFAQSVIKLFSLLLTM